MVTCVCCKNRWNTYYKNNSNADNIRRGVVLESVYNWFRGRGKKSYVMNTAIKWVCPHCRCKNTLIQVDGVPSADLLRFLVGA